MFDSLKFLEDRKKQKAVDDPSVRRGDPACWECLSDEQRDMIHEWYMDRLIDQAYAREVANPASQSSWPAIIGLIPLAFSHAAKDSLSLPILDFLLRFVVTLVSFYVVFLLFSSVYLFAREAKPSVMHKYEYIWFHLVAVFAALFVTMFVLGHVML